MPCEHGDEAECQAAEEVEHHIGVVLVFQESCPLVHEGGEGGETTAEPRGEEQFCGWRHHAAAIPVEPRKEPDDEASRHIHRHRAEWKGNHRAGLHHL